MSGAEAARLADNAWLTRKQAASFLEGIGCPISPSTLANLAVRGNSGSGPPYTVVSVRMIRYMVGDLRRWATKRTRRVE